MSMIVPCLIRSVAAGELRSIRLGHPVLDDYLEFVGARARTNTWLAAAYDLKVFFSVIVKEPAAVTTADVFAFIKAQRAPRRGLRVVRLEDGEAGLSVRTIKRRGARRRAGIDHLTCHQLRHTCLTRLREAGMALEAVQAQAGHRSIESTRVYLHLSAGWLATEYTNALAAIDAQSSGTPSDGGL
jgi:integrase